MQLKKQPKFPLSRRNKHKIYIKALEVYKECLQKGRHHGLCYAISEAYRRNHGEIQLKSKETKDLLLELYNHRPDADYSIFWWPIKDTDSRIKVLEQLINETKWTHYLKKLSMRSILRL